MSFLRDGRALEDSLTQELRELREKEKRLQRFIANHSEARDSFLWHNHIQLLQKQLLAMREYDAILELRIEIHHINMAAFH